MDNTIKTLVAQLAAFDETAIAALEHAAQDEFRDANYPEDKANQEAAYILMTAARDIQRIAAARATNDVPATDRKSTRLNSSHWLQSRMPSSA